MSTEPMPVPVVKSEIVLPAEVPKEVLDVVVDNGRILNPVASIPLQEEIDYNKLQEIKQLTKQTTPIGGSVPALMKKTWEANISGLYGLAPAIVAAGYAYLQNHLVKRTFDALCAELITIPNIAATLAYIYDLYNLVMMNSSAAYSRNAFSKWLISQVSDQAIRNINYMSRIDEYTSVTHGNYNTVAIDVSGVSTSVVLDFAPCYHITQSRQEQVIPRYMAAPWTSKYTEPFKGSDAGPFVSQARNTLDVYDLQNIVRQYRVVGTQVDTIDASFAVSLARLLLMAQQFLLIEGADMRGMFAGIFSCPDPNSVSAVESTFWFPLEPTGTMTPSISAYAVDLTTFLKMIDGQGVPPNAAVAVSTFGITTAVVPLTGDMMNLRSSIVAWLLSFLAYPFNYIHHTSIISYTDNTFDTSRFWHPGSNYVKIGGPSTNVLFVIVDTVAQNNPNIQPVIVGASAVPIWNVTLPPPLAVDITPDVIALYSSLEFVQGIKDAINFWFKMFGNSQDVRDAMIMATIAYAQNVPNFGAGTVGNESILTYRTVQYARPAGNPPNPINAPGLFTPVTTNTYTVTPQRSYINIWQQPCSTQANVQFNVYSHMQVSVLANTIGPIVASRIYVPIDPMQTTMTISDWVYTLIRFANQIENLVQTYVAKSRLSYAELFPFEDVTTGNVYQNIFNETVAARLIHICRNLLFGSVTLNYQTNLLSINNLFHWVGNGAVIDKSFIKYLSPVRKPQWLITMQYKGIDKSPTGYVTTKMMISKVKKTDPPSFGELQLIKLATMLNSDNFLQDFSRLSNFVQANGNNFLLATGVMLAPDASPVFRTTFNFLDPVLTMDWFFKLFRMGKGPYNINPMCLSASDAVPIRLNDPSVTGVLMDVFVQENFAVALETGKAYLGDKFLLETSSGQRRDYVNAAGPYPFLDK